MKTMPLSSIMPSTRRLWTASRSPRSAASTRRTHLSSSRYGRPASTACRTMQETSRTLLSGIFSTRHRWEGNDVGRSSDHSGAIPLDHSLTVTRSLVTQAREHIRARHPHMLAVEAVHQNDRAGVFSGKVEGVHARESRQKQGFGVAVLCAEKHSLTKSPQTCRDRQMSTATVAKLANSGVHECRNWGRLKSQIHKINRNLGE